MDTDTNTPFYENRGVVGSSVHQPRSRVALGLARGLQISRALDLGCGDGEVTAELGRVIRGEVVGADVSQVAVDLCILRGIEAHKVDPSEGLPFPDKSFDLVFMTEVIEHLVEPSRTMREIRRVLSPKGYLILSTPNLACLPNRLLLLMGIQPLFTEVSEDHIHGRHFRFLGQAG